MKIKTSALSGTQLDWAVAKAEGHDLEDPTWWADFGNECVYSTDWTQGGPIIEQGRIGIEPWGANISWLAQIYNEAGRVTQRQYGPTPLIAAMRCYVLSKLGEEVEVPDATT